MLHSFDSLVQEWFAKRTPVVHAVEVTKTRGGSAADPTFTYSREGILYRLTVSVNVGSLHKGLLIYALNRLVYPEWYVGNFHPQLTIRVPDIPCTFHLPAEVGDLYHLLTITPGEPGGFVPYLLNPS